MSPREYIVSILKRYPKRGWHKLVWTWAPGKPLRRYYVLKNFSWEKYVKNKRAGRRKRAAKWLERHEAAKAKFFAAKRKAAALDFESWMLNGHSGNIDPKLKPVIAYAVGELGQTITDTYDYSGHTSSSYHYPWNDPSAPQQGRAVDMGGSGMATAQSKLASKFGDGQFAELFGPAGWYLKNGNRYQNPGGGAFPGHDDHIHAARPQG